MSQRKRPAPKGKQKISKKQAQRKVSKPKWIPNTPFQWALGGIMFALAFLLYANTLGHGWALDDNSVLKDSHIVRGGAKEIGTIFATPYRYGTFGDGGSVYRPMSVAMFAVEWGMLSDNPADIESLHRAKLHHWVNVLLYALSCMLLFLTLRRVLKGYSLWIPLIATALFVAHPVHTEIVANIKSRDEILTFLFGILALNMIWRYASDTSDKKYWLFSLLAFTAALFSKENAVNFVALIPLTLFFFSKLPLREIGIIAASYLAPTLVFIGIRASILGSTTGQKTLTGLDNFLANAPDFISQKATAFLVLGKYLLLLLVPYPLICDYNYNYIPITGLGDWRVLLSILVHLGLLAFAIMNLKKKHLISYAIFFYIISMALYSNLVIVIGAGMGDRFLYIGSLGFCLAVAYLLVKFLGGGERQEAEPTDWASLTQGKMPVMGILAAVLLVFGYMTFDRNMDWKDSYTLYQADIEKAPESARLNGYLGTAYMNQGSEATDENEKQRFYDLANQYHGKAVEIFPNYSEAWGQLGLGYSRKGDYFWNVIKDTQKGGEYYTQSAQHYERAMQDPNCKGSIYSNYAVLFFQNGQRLQNSGRPEEARRDFEKARDNYEKAVQRQPNYPEGWMNLGSSYGMLGNHRKAAECFVKALKYDAKNAATINQMLSVAYSNLGETAKSQAAAAEAQRLRAAGRK